MQDLVEYRTKPFKILVHIAQKRIEYIDTPEGQLTVHKGDAIIQGPLGSKQVIRKVLFENLCELVPKKKVPLPPKKVAPKPYRPAVRRQG